MERKIESLRIRSFTCRSDKNAQCLDSSQLMQTRMKYLKIFFFNTHLELFAFNLSFEDLGNDCHFSIFVCRVPRYKRDF